MEMKRWWRGWRGVVAALVAIVFGVLLMVWLWRVSAPGDAGTQLGTFATAVSAAAAAVAALASWRSAARSDATSRRAAEALGMSFRPDLRTSFIPPFDKEDGSRTDAYVEVRNHSLWPAINVSVVVDSGEGWTREASVARIEGGHLPAGDGYPDNPAVVRLPVAPTAKAWHPIDHPEWRGERQIVETTTVEFEDERGLLRWRRTQEWERTYSVRDETSSSGSGMRGTSLTRLR